MHLALRQRISEARSICLLLVLETETPSISESFLCYVSSGIDHRLGQMIGEPFVLWWSFRYGLRTKGSHAINRKKSTNWTRKQRLTLQGVYLRVATQRMGHSHNLLSSTAHHLEDT